MSGIVSVMRPRPIGHKRRIHLPFRARPNQFATARSADEPEAIAALFDEIALDLVRYTPDAFEVRWSLRPQASP
jgi:hypothetical protein